MRFVAILALCLVAISTLVDELPPPGPATADAAPLPVAPDPAPADSEARVFETMVPAPPASPPGSAAARAGGAEPITDLPQSIGAEPQPAAVAPPARERPASRSVGLDAAGSRPATPAPRTPTAPPRATPAAPAELPATAPTPAEDSPRAVQRRGFTLRFASDAALLRLVAGGAAQLFVFAGDETLRLGLEPSGPAFTPAAGPSQFHAVDATTVPALLRDALVAGGFDPGAVVWGVTLPAATRASLAEMIRAHDGGELVIDQRGRVRLEVDDG
jgi:hypothetical protein